MEHLGSKDYYPSWIVSVTQPIPPISLTRILQICFERRLETLNYL